MPTKNMLPGDSEPDAPTVESYSDRKRRFARETILDAAHDLMRKNPEDDFSMRDLAGVAGMAVTTVFSHFGSKGGVLRGLIDRLLERIDAVYEDRVAGDADTVGRVMTMASAGLDTVLEEQGVNQRILGTLLVVGDEHVYDELRRQTDQLWIKALGDGSGLDRDALAIGLPHLSEQMTVTFRGALALWIAEGLTETAFRRVLLQGIALNLLGFVDGEARSELIRTYCTD